MNKNSEENYSQNNQQNQEEVKKRPKTPISSEKTSFISKPKFIIESFMDHVEKFNEKSELWQTKFIAIFLKKKFMCVYDKKPSK